jgi:hypothetical protein
MLKGIKFYLDAFSCSHGHKPLTTALFRIFVQKWSEER